MKQRKEAGTLSERRLEIGREYDPANPDSNWLVPGETRPEQPVKLIQGYEWAQVPGIDERLEECLWNAGIVAPEDLYNKTQAAIGALMSYHGLDLTGLRQKVKEHQDGKQ